MEHAELGPVRSAIDAALSIVRAVQDLNGIEKDEVQRLLETALRRLALVSNEPDPISRYEQHAEGCAVCQRDAAACRLGYMLLQTAATYAGDTYRRRKQGSSAAEEPEDPDGPSQH